MSPLDFVLTSKYALLVYPLNLEFEGVERDALYQIMRNKINVTSLLSG
jgi:hypothetical protein